MEYLDLKAIVTWNRNGVVCIPSEHNRTAMGAGNERIKHSNRMKNGRLRQYYVADKRTWTISWDMLPAPDSETVDGKAGAASIEKFHNETAGEFTMTIQHADSSLDETVLVVFSDFDKTHVRRGKYDFWDISVGIEEV